MPLFGQLDKKISNLSQDAIKKTKDISHDAVKKTKDLTEITKLNMKINTEEENIKNFYGKIGELYYNEYGSSPHEKFTELCGAVTESFNNIQSFKDEITKIKSSDKCPNCGAHIENNTKFCTNCGSKITDNESL